MIEFKNNVLYVKGEPLKNFKYMSNPALLAEFIVNKKAFTREELREFCYENEIPLNHFDVFMSSLNKEVKKKFKKPLILYKGNKFNRVYYINPAFDKENKKLIQLYIPAKEFEKYKNELQKYIVKDSNEKSV